jgi:hypothetical protein
MLTIGPLPLTPRTSRDRSNKRRRSVPSAACVSLRRSRHPAGSGCRLLQRQREDPFLGAGTGTAGARGTGTPLPRGLTRGADYSNWETRTVIGCTNPDSRNHRAARRLRS